MRHDKLIMFSKLMWIDVYGIWLPSNKIYGAELEATTQMDKEKPCNNQFSSLFAPKTFFAEQSLSSTLLKL